MKTPILFATLFAATFVAAQEVPQFPSPQKEHEWLQQFAGDWETHSKAMMGPDQPEIKCEGAIHSRMLGGFWIVSEMKSEAMGMAMNGVQTIGYDAKKKKYVGTWVDSMSDHMWRYEGSVDESGKILTLEAEGPNFMKPGEMSKFQDIYEFKSKDHIAISSTMQGEDGKWITFMTGEARRKK